MSGAVNAFHRAHKVLNVHHKHFIKSMHLCLSDSVQASLGLFGTGEKRVAELSFLSLSV